MRSIKKFMFPLLLLACAIGPHVVERARAAIWQWSTTAATNATADPSINWAEGMSPSSVNDSARAMMARIAEWNKDISGNVALNGTASAMTAASNEGYPNQPIEAQMLSVFANVTNAVGATLAVDGGIAKPVWTTLGVPIAPGVIVAGSQFRLRYTTGGGGGWLLEGVYGAPTIVPLGGMVPYTGDTAPSSAFVLANGQCISRATYATYFALIGTRFGACDGTTTFAVIDMRGTSPVGSDTMATAAAGRMTNDANGCGVVFQTVGTRCGAQSQTLTAAQIPAHTHPNTLTDPGHSHLYTTLVGPSGGALGTGPTASFNTISTQASVTGITINNASNAGGGGAHPIVMPSVAVTYLVRVI